MQKVQISDVVKTGFAAPGAAYFIDYCGAEFAPACVIRHFVDIGMQAKRRFNFLYSDILEPLNDVQNAMDIISSEF